MRKHKIPELRKAEIEENHKIRQSIWVNLEKGKKQKLFYANTRKKLYLKFIGKHQVQFGEIF